MDKKTVKRGLLPYLFIGLLMIGMYLMFNISNFKVTELSYDEFIENLDGGKIEVLEIVPRTSGYTYDVSGKLEGYKDNESFAAVLPLSDEVMKKIVEASDNQEFKLVTKPDPASSSFLMIIVNVLPFVILILDNNVSSSISAYSSGAITRETYAHILPFRTTSLHLG